MKSKITLYTTRVCPYCVRAKRLLQSKQVEYEEVDTGADSALWQQMTERSGGRRTVPQIFIGDLHIGGSDDLSRLELAGELDRLLGLE